MTDMPEHARIPIIKPVTAKTAAWAVLIVVGGTQVTYNIWHAVLGGRLNIFLAILYGIVPVFTAMCLSHIVATYKGGRVMQAITFLVMLGAMGLSISASAAVVAPAAGPDLRKWVFGLVLDTGVLVALRVILSEREQDAARQETERAEAAAREEATGAAALEAARAEAAAAAARTAEVEAELAARTATMEADLARSATALEVERARAETLAAVRGSGPRTAPGPLPRGGSGRSGTGPADDLALEAKALELLEGDPEMSGAALARELGITPGYGRKLRRRLTGQDRQGEPSERSQDRTGIDAGDRSEDRAEDRP